MRRLALFIYGEKKKSIKNVGNFDFHPAERALVFGETLQSLQTRTGTFPGEEAFVREFHRVWVLYI